MGFSENLIKKSMPSLLQVLKSFDEQLEEQLLVQKEILAELKTLNEKLPAQSIE